MRLTRAGLEHVGIVRGPLHLTFGPGLNVIHGPNEIGKSTVQRALRDVLTLRAKSTGSELERFRPHDGSTPLVELGFEQDGVEYLVQKKFAGQGGTVRLSWSDARGPQQLAGDEAEARLRQLVGTGESKRGRGDEGCWPLLWVEQGRSGLEPTEDLRAGGRQRLNDRLAEATGVVLAGTGGAALHRRAKDEFLRFWTEKGAESRSENAPLHVARERLTAAIEASGALTRRSREHEQNVERFARVEEQARLLARSLPALEADLRAVELEQRRLEQLREQHRERRLQAELARTKAEAASRQVQERAALRTRRADELERCRRLDESRTDARTRLDLHVARGPSLLAAVRACQEALAEADRLRRRAGANLDAVRARGPLEALRRQLDSARSAHARGLEARGRLDALPLDDAALARLEALERTVHKADAALLGAAPGVRVQALRPLAFELDGRRIELESQAIHDTTAISSTRLVFGDLAVVEVTPAGKELPKLRREATAAATALQTALAKDGAATLDEARRRAADRRTAHGDLEVAGRTLAAFAPHGLEALERELAQKEAAVDGAARQLAERTRPTDPALPDDEPGARDTAETCERSESAARTALEQSQTAAAEHGHRHDTLRLELAQLEEQALEATRRRDDLDRALTRSEAADGPDDRLKAEEFQTVTDLDSAERQLEVMTEAVTRADPDGVAAAVVRAQRALTNGRAEQQQVTGELGQLRGALQALDLIGLHERLGAAEAEEARARAEVGRFEAQARAVKLLYDILNACQREAEERFTEPLRHELEPLLRTAFPGAALDFDDAFAVRGLRRAGRGEDRFDALSGGAREQLAVLVRLGMARVLAGKGTLPVIIDDGLTATDEERFRRMTAALDLASRQLQIVLITCHWERYRRLGVDAAQVTDLDALRRAAEHRTDLASVA